MAGPRQRRLKEISNADLATAVDELAQLIVVRFPQRVHRGEGQWPIVAHGLVAQMLSAIRSITSLDSAGSHNEVLVLLRALYEQVVTFCWLAIDPELHLVAWANEAQLERLKLHNDATAFGYSILGEQEADEIRTRKGIPPLIQRADAVDKYWAPRIAGFRDHPKQGAKQILTMRGLYVGLYRTTSRAAHAHVGSVGPFVDVSRYPRHPAVVKLQRTSPDFRARGTPNRCPRVVGLQLQVPLARCGWGAGAQCRVAPRRGYRISDDPEGS